MLKRLIGGLMGGGAQRGRHGGRRAAGGAGRGRRGGRGTGSQGARIGKMVERVIRSR